MMRSFIGYYPPDGDYIYSDFVQPTALPEITII